MKLIKIELVKKGSLKLFRVQEKLSRQFFKKYVWLLGGSVAPNRNFDDRQSLVSNIRFLSIGTSFPIHALDNVIPYLYLNGIVLYDPVFGDPLIILYI